MMRHTKQILCAAIVFLVGSQAYATNQIQARGLAMGSAHLVGARGVEVVGFNPAFLGFEEAGSFTLQLPALTPNIGFRLSNDFLSLNQINNHFEADKFWDNEEKQEILDAFDGNEWDIYNDFHIPIFGLSFKTKYLSVGINAETFSNMDIKFSKQFIELALMGHGFDQYGKPRDFSDTDLRAQVYTKIGFTFAKQFLELPQEVEWIDEFTAGFTVNYLMGHVYGDLEEASGTFLTDTGVMETGGMVRTVNAGATEEDGEINVDDPMNGSGMSFDLGFGAKMFEEKAIFGVSFINLGNKISWTNAEKRIYSFDARNAPPLENLNHIDEWLEKNLSTVDSLAGEDLDYETHVPSMMNLTAGYRPLKDLLVASNIRVGLNDAPGMSKSIRFGVGAEYEGLKALPLRMGWSVGGRGAFTYGMGFGLRLGFLRTDFGWAWERGMMNSANGLHFAWNTIWVF